MEGLKKKQGRKIIGWDWKKCINISLQCWILSYTLKKLIKQCQDYEPLKNPFLSHRCKVTAYRITDTIWTHRTPKSHHWRALIHNEGTVYLCSAFKCSTAPCWLYCSVLSQNKACYSEKPFNDLDLLKMLTALWNFGWKAACRGGVELECQGSELWLWQYILILALKQYLLN